MAEGGFDRVMRGLWSVRRSTGEALSRLSFWPDVVRVCRILVSPVTGFARALLKIFPFLRHVEWLLELQSLTRRHPVPLALALAYVFWRGIRVTHLGHIGTDPIIYPFMAVVSGFNPCLGFAAGVIYGVGDLVQKFFRPDIYGVNLGRNDPNFWPSMTGYAVAYTSLMCMGILPGVSARVFRVIVLKIVSGMMRPRAVAHADGAGQTTSPDPAAGGDAISLAGILAAAAGGGIAGYVVMDSVAPVLESPAFMWRPSPDVSCMRVETGLLTGHAGGGLRAGGAGGVVQVLTPPPPPPRRAGSDWNRALGPDEVNLRDPGRPDWSLMNRPGEEYSWDANQERWVRKGESPEIRHYRTETGAVEEEPPEIHRFRTQTGTVEEEPPDIRRYAMETGTVEEELEGREMVVHEEAPDEAEEVRRLREGWEWDPYQEMWRTPPEHVPPVDLGGGKRPETVHYTPFSFETPSTSAYEVRLRDLEYAERDALNDFARYDAEREEARRAGDRWLEEKLTREMQAAGDNVRAAQAQKDALVAQADREQKYDDAIRNVGVGEAAGSAVGIAGQVVKDVFAPDYSFTVQQMQRGIEARNRFQGQSDQLEARWREQDELMARYRDVKHQFDATTDPELRRRLQQEGGVLRERFQDSVAETDRFTQAAAEYVQENARSTLTVGAAATDTALRGGGALSASRMAHRVIDPEAVPWTPRLHGEIQGSTKPGARGAGSVGPRPAGADEFVPGEGPARFGSERAVDAGAASPEAMSRMRVNRLFRVDTNTRQVTEVLGPHAADAPLAPHEVMVIKNSVTGKNDPAGVGLNFEVNQGGRRAALDRAYAAVDEHLQASPAGTEVRPPAPTAVAAAGEPEVMPPRWESGPPPEPEPVTSAGGAGEPPSGGGGVPPEGSGPRAPSEPDLRDLLRRESGGESVVERKVASAEAKAPLVDRGEPLPDAEKPLPSTQEDWRLRDRIEGVEGGPPRVGQLQVLGVERPPEVELVARADPDFAKVDDLVRDAYRRSGGGFNLPGDTHWRWENFQANLAANGVSEEAFSQWVDRVGAIKYVPPGPTMVQ